MRKIKLLAVVLLLISSQGAQAAEFSTEQVSARVEHTEVIDSEHRLWGFGKNSSGQIGNGTNSDVFDAVQIAPSTRFKQVATGKDHTAAVTMNGKLLTWGNNRYGQLGDPFCASRNSPASVYINELEIGYVPYFVSVFAGYNFTIAVDSRNAVWAFGQNNHGQLGVGGHTNASVLTKVKLLAVPEKIACSEKHCICVTKSGSVYVWGANEYGQLGDGTTAEHCTPELLALPDVARDVAAGNEHSVVVLKSGLVLTAGNGKSGAIGRNPGESVNSEMEPIGSYSGITFVHAAAGKDFSVLVDNCGVLYVAGLGLSGQLGTGRIDSELSVRKVDTLAKFNEGAVGETYSVFSDSEHNLWSWGTGEHGQLGNDCERSYSPIQCVQTPEVAEQSSPIVPAVTSESKKKLTVDGVKYSVVGKNAALVKAGSTKRNVVVGNAVRAGGKQYRLTRIERNAFSQCPKLKKIAIEADGKLQIANGAFRGLNKKCIVQVKTNRAKRAVLSSGIKYKNRVRKVK